MMIYYILYYMSFCMIYHMALYYDTQWYMIIYYISPSVTGSTIQLTHYVKLQDISWAAIPFEWLKDTNPRTGHAYERYMIYSSRQEDCHVPNQTAYQVFHCRNCLTVPQEWSAARGGQWYSSQGRWLFQQPPLRCTKHFLAFSTKNVAEIPEKWAWRVVDFWWGKGWDDVFGSHLQWP